MFERKNACVAATARATRRRGTGVAVQHTAAHTEHDARDKLPDINIGREPHAARLVLQNELVIGCSHLERE
jgi:hypothetical protein